MAGVPVTVLVVENIGATVISANTPIGEVAQSQEVQTLLRNLGVDNESFELGVLPEPAGFSANITAGQVAPLLDKNNRRIILVAVPSHGTGAPHREDLCCPDDVDLAAVSADVTGKRGKR